MEAGRRVRLAGQAGLVLAAGLVAGGLWVAPAHAGPAEAATISLTNGDFAWNANGGLSSGDPNVPGSFNEVVTGNYAFTNTIPSATTPYDFVASGSLTLDGNPVGSIKSPVLQGSLSSVESQSLTSLGPYGSLLAGLVAALVNNSPGSTTVAVANNLIPGNSGGTGATDITLAWDYSSGSSFTLGVSYNTAAPGTWGGFINGGLGSLTGSTSTNDIFAAQGTLAVVPEPGSMMLLTTGLLGLGMLVMRRRGA